MQIMYCETCGVRVPEEDLQSGVALRDGTQRAHCAKCSQAQRPTKNLTRPPTRENAILSRPMKPASGGVARPVTARASGLQPATASNSNAIWIAVGVGAGVFGLLLIVFASRGNPAPKDSPQVPATVVVPAIPAVDPTGKTDVKLAVPLPETVALKRPPANETPATVTLKKPPVEAAADPGIDDIRENFARRKWVELKADIEKAMVNGASTPGARGRVRDFANTYATTAVGKEAADFMRKMVVEGPPVPGATIFASYSRDFQSPSPGKGWRYMWNPSGPAGESAKYASLVWNETKTQYCGNPNEYPVPPAMWVQLRKGAGHPGPGTDQNQPTDRFAIAAYTLQPGQSGRTWAVGTIHRHTTDPGTIELRVYLNDTLKTSLVTAHTNTPFEFSADMGVLNPGDNIYVCVGPSKGDGNDSFNLEYSIYPNP